MRVVCASLPIIGFLLDLQIDLRRENATSTLHHDSQRLSKDRTQPRCLGCSRRAKRVTVRLALDEDLSASGYRECRYPSTPRTRNAPCNQTPKSVDPRLSPSPTCDAVPHESLSVNEMTDPQQGSDIRLELDAARRVNFAYAQNDIPVIKTLSLKNTGHHALEAVEIRLEAEPAVIRSKTWAIDRLGPNKCLALADLATTLDLPRLSGLNETEVGSLTLTVADATGPLLTEQRPLELLARDQWGGLGDMDRLLAAFVAPNDAVVAEILKKASLLLERSGQDGALEGYQSGDPQRVWMIAGAIWSAITGMGLTYATPPASFEVNGQKIRSPERIRSEGLTTCLDSSLLLAAAWEQAGLNPVVLFSEGHAWAGVWITRRDFKHVTEQDVVTVRKAAQAKEFIPVETTLLTRRPTVGFQIAAEAGRARLSEDREHEFQVAIDITRARSARIRPLASHRRRNLTASEGQRPVKPRPPSCRRPSILACYPPS